MNNPGLAFRVGSYENMPKPCRQAVQEKGGDNTRRKNENATGRSGRTILLYYFVKPATRRVASLWGSIKFSASGRAPALCQFGRTISRKFDRELANA